MALPLVTIGLAILVTAMTCAAATGRLEANGVVGIRTRTTQRSEAAWVAAHRAALRVVVPASSVIVVLCVVAIVWTPAGFTEEATGLVLLGAYTVALVVSGMVAQRAAKGVTPAR